MFARKGLSFLRNSVQKNQRQFLNQEKQTLFASYATENKGTQLDESVRKVLKPEVLKAVESKTDSLLMKKLNFLGKYLVCRLNIASQLILNSLTQENCFRIIVNELDDPWEHYWRAIKQNGQDADKWLESLKEVQHLPLIADRCWRSMMLSGVYPTTEHYNVYLEALANTNDNFFLHDTLDDLMRRNPYESPNDRTQNIILENYIKHKDAHRTKYQLDYMEANGVSVESSIESRAKELASQFDEEQGAKWAFDKGGEKPQWETTKEETGQQNHQIIMDKVDEYIQPSFEKLVVKE